MNNSEERANALAHQDERPTFGRLITSNLVLHNGVKSQVLTFIPLEIDWEAVIAGLNTALKASETVAAVHHNLSVLRNGEVIQSKLFFHPKAFDNRH